MERSAARWRRMARSGRGGVRFSARIQDGGGRGCGRMSRLAPRVRSGEGHPLTLLRARLSDWGDEGRLLAISSPVIENDSIGLLFRDGDRRRLEYPCLQCGGLTPFEWSQVTGRERGEVPAIACIACGVPHSEGARRKMLRSCEWVAQRPRPDGRGFDHPSDLSRLDSARASLAQVT